MKVTTLAALLVLTQVMTACQSPPPNPSGDEIVIASDLAITSPATADFAVPLQQAIELAVRQQGKIGRFRLTYLSLDDSLGAAVSQAKGVHNVRRMISDPRVLGMIGPANSNTVYAEIPVANASDFVMLSPSTTNVCVTLPVPYCSPQPKELRAKGPSNYFRIAPPDSIQGRALARYVVGNLNVRSVAAFNELPGGGDLILDSFTDELVRLGGALVVRQDLAHGTTGFTSFLAEARAKNAQAIYAVNGAGKDHVCVAAAQAASEFPGGVYFLGTDAIAGDDGCIKDALNNADGMIVTVPDVDSTQSHDPAVDKMVQAYRNTYPWTSFGIDTYIFAAYDCARLLIDAISRAVQATGGAIPTRKQVLEAVAHTQQFKGVTGTYSFDSNGDAISPLMSLYKVENGKWVFKDKIDASANPT